MWPGVFPLFPTFVKISRWSNLIQSIPLVSNFIQTFQSSLNTHYHQSYASQNFNIHLNTIGLNISENVMSWSHQLLHTHTHPLRFHLMASVVHLFFITVNPIQKYQVTHFQPAAEKPFCRISLFICLPATKFLNEISNENITAIRHSHTARHSTHIYRPRYIFCSLDICPFRRPSSSSSSSCFYEQAIRIFKFIINQFHVLTKTQSRTLRSLFCPRRGKNVTFPFNFIYGYPMFACRHSLCVFIWVWNIFSTKLIPWQPKSHHCRKFVLDSERCMEIWFKIHIQYSRILGYYIIICWFLMQFCLSNNISVLSLSHVTHLCTSMLLVAVFFSFRSIEENPYLHRHAYIFNLTVLYQFVLI